MKFTLARTLSIAQTRGVAIYAPRHSRGTAHYFHLLRSVGAGATYLVRRLFIGDVSVVISKLRKLISDGPAVPALVEHFDVVRTLNGSARALTSRYPNYANKYASDYLAKRFDKQTRREILLFHHRYLAHRVNESFYNEMATPGHVLWDETINGNTYAISMSFNHQHHSEGDLTLTFDMNRAPIYEILFSIVPGKVIGSAANQVLLVGAVQGRLGQAKAIKGGTKACGDIAPPHLLVSAATSIAEVLGIEAFAGVGNEEQLQKSQANSGCFFDYDAFWETFSVRKNSTSIYEGTIPLPEKPIEQTKSKHRSKVRSKRRLRKDISERVAAAFARKFMKVRDMCI